MFVVFCFVLFSFVLVVVCIRQIVPPVSFVGCVLEFCFALLVMFSERIEFGYFCFVLFCFVLFCFVLFCLFCFVCFGGGVRKTNSAFPVSVVSGAFFVVFFLVCSVRKTLFCLVLWGVFTRRTFKLALRTFVVPFVVPQ